MCEGLGSPLSHPQNKKKVEQAENQQLTGFLGQ